MVIKLNSVIVMHFPFAPPTNLLLLQVGCFVLSHFWCDVKWQQRNVIPLTTEPELWPEPKSEPEPTPEIEPEPASEPEPEPEFEPEPIIEAISQPELIIEQPEPLVTGMPAICQSCDQTGFTTEMHCLRGANQWQGFVRNDFKSCVRRCRKAEFNIYVWP